MIAGAGRALRGLRSPLALARFGTHNFGWFHRELARQRAAPSAPVPVPPPREGAPRSTVKLSFRFGRQEGKDVQLELFDDLVPRTCANFVALCRSGYPQCRVHYIKRRCLIASGDVVDGSGRHSVCSFDSKPFFEDENFVVQYNHPFMLGMINSGVHTNGSQFFISLVPMPHLNGRNVAFGRVVDGFEEVKKIAGAFTDHMKPYLDIRLDNIRVEQS